MEFFDVEFVFVELFEKISILELYIEVFEVNKFKIMEKLVLEVNFEGGNLVKIDGVRVDFLDSWGLICVLNIILVLVVCFEGDLEVVLEQVKIVFCNQLKVVEFGLNIFFQ